MKVQRCPPCAWPRLIGQAVEKRLPLQAEEEQCLCQFLRVMSPKK